MSRTARIPRTIALLTTTMALSALVGCGSWDSDTKTVVVDHGAVTEKSGAASQWVAATPDKYGKVCRQVPVQKAAWSTQLSASVPLKPGPKPAPKKPAVPQDTDSGADTPAQPKSPGLTKPTAPSKAPNKRTPGKPQGPTKEVCGRGLVRKGIPGHWTDNQRVLALKDKKGNTTRWRVSETLWQQAELKSYFDLRKAGSGHHRI
ncbi:hypothetical protein [Streptomyces sp. S1D4-20]|uniref:hypothetical protein n=1 Tax=Streptomyces sp. S1D4-20 TaxID=2594462 RepID=UPI001163A5C1|nr:hypothetical protein [Streptomyces sp. S1D4-20]QDN54220.1 hypothetical protein FNV67_01230 [Streptomyces sp. S1D4-20]